MKFFVSIAFLLFCLTGSGQAGIQLPKLNPSNISPYSILQRSICKKVSFSKATGLNLTPSFYFKSPFSYRDQLGFICKWELDRDKIKKPVRFRLGSYDYVNRLEGK